MTNFYIIIGLALIGFLVSLKIYKDKQKPKPLVCPLGADCEKVVRGEFSSFLGIGLEIFGGFYYLLILIFYTIISFIHFPYIEILKFIFLIISGMAFLFSMFLTFLQAAVIKSWCSWCLISALITTLILISSIVEYF